MSAARAHANAYKRPGALRQHRPPPLAPAQRPYCDAPADFSKVDSILRHLQQTESHDWLGEITHCCTQVCYLLLQNYNIARLTFHNYNYHLIVLTALFFAQRIWAFLWRATQLSDAHSLRFACHITLFLVLLDSLYCGTQLALKGSFVGGLYLATPLLSSLLFYQVYLKMNTNVFTAELFSMLSRCVYHSLETAYCIGVLPLKFLQCEYIYFDTSRCMVLTAFVTVHSFLSLFCLELHCLGSEVLQQARMLGEWRSIPDVQRLKAIAPKPTEWSHHDCPYPRGAVVRCKGRYYEAMAGLNTCTPTSSPHWIWSVAAVLGDSQRTKALVLAALLVLNATLVHLMLWSNQWSMYAVMLVPNFGHFLYVKYRRSHLFFNPAHLNLRQLQWDLNTGMPHCKLNGAGGPRPCSFPSSRRCRTPLGEGPGWGYGDDLTEEEGDNSHTDDVLADPSYGNRCGGGVADAGLTACLHYPNPLFLSAVSASTMFFFGPSARSHLDLGHSAHDDGQEHM